MRGIKKYISRNWIWIVAGLVLTEIFVKVAYTERGYVAYGGEWLTLPLILMMVETVKNVGGTVQYLFGTEDDYESERD